VSTTKKQGAKKKSVFSRIWNFFNSIKLTLTVLLTLAAVSIIGTVVQQDQPLETYAAEYGEAWADFILKAGFNDMYHTPWFSFLLIILVLNIAVCTFERFPPKWKVLLTGKPNFSPGFIEKLSNSDDFTLSEDFDSVKARVVKALKKKRYKVLEEEQDSGHAFVAWKGKIGRFGSDFTHISLFLILAGAIIGSAIGYKGFKVVTVGSEFSAPKNEYKIRLDRFWLEYYETGQIRQYNSVLTVIEDGKDVLTKQIWVNEPLFYKGTRYYQSSWGKSWKKVSEAEIAFKPKGSEVAGKPVRLKWKEKRDLPGTDYEVKLVAYVADFAFDEKTKTVYSKGIEELNPAIMLEVFKNGKRINAPWLFLKYPGLFKAIPKSDDDIVFTGYQGILFSGLSVNNDPGTNVVWAGTIVMGFGFILAFFVFHRRVWVNIKRSEGGTRVIIGGMINKNNIAIEKDLEDLISVIKGTDSKG
jgi:cytochrome c biogenesis protein